MAYIYARNGTLYLAGRRNGVAVWKSCRTGSKRVAQDFLRRFVRGEAIPELGILAEGDRSEHPTGIVSHKYGQSGAFQERVTKLELGNENRIRAEKQTDLSCLTVGELCDRWIEHCESYYRGEDGQATGEVGACRAAVVPLRELYGDSAAGLFGPVALKRVRERMISLGWVRSSVNKQCGRVKRCFAWGVENEIVPASVLEGLRAVRGLRRGRSEAREAVAVGPVPEDALKGVLGVCGRILGAMVMAQLLSAARPGEIVILRPCDFDCSGAVWIARPGRFKTQYRGLSREIYFGPRAQEVIGPFMDRDAQQFLFSPLEAEAERRLALVRGEDQSGASRDEVSSLSARAFQECVTKRELGNERRRERDRLNYARRRGGVIKSRRPGSRYTVASYRRAIGRICAELEIVAWNPNQLRHNAGTEIRKLYGLEAAQVILGHARADVTQVYAEANRAKAVALIGEIG